MRAPLPLSPALPRSPLRYPGGKSRAARAIASFIPQTERSLCSPFLGGGSVELFLSHRMRVKAFDVFGPLVDFWKELLEDPDRLSLMVRQYYPLSREKFYSLQERMREGKLFRLERAAIFFALNRASFSGVTLSGGMSPGHPRFNLSAIRRVETFKRPANFKVKRGDFRDVIPAHPEDFLYLDPPYWIRSDNLYGIRGDTHKGFPHLALFDLLSRRNRWVLSYNDSPEVRELYKNYRIESLSWVYGMGNDKRSREILILSEEAK